MTFSSSLVWYFRDVVKDMKADFMGDLTIPDGTKVQPGTKFVKTWKIKNSGNIPWRESTKVLWIHLHKGISCTCIFGKSRPICSQEIFFVSCSTVYTPSMFSLWQDLVKLALDSIHVLQQVYDIVLCYVIDNPNTWYHNVLNIVMWCFSAS